MNQKHSKYFAKKRSKTKKRLISPPLFPFLKNSFFQRSMNGNHFNISAETFVKFQATVPNFVLSESKDERSTKNRTAGLRFRQSGFLLCFKNDYWIKTPGTGRSLPAPKVMPIKPLAERFKYHVPFRKTEMSALPSPS